MPNPKLLYVSFIIFSLYLSACSTTRCSLLTTDKYDEKADMTIFTMLPCPSIDIKIPGKWTSPSYKESSRQFFFKNDSQNSSFAVGVAPHKNKFEFYKTDMSNNDFLSAYYTWDAEYLSEQSKLSHSKIKEDLDNSYIIWRLGDTSKEYIFLLGMKNKAVVNLMIDSNGSIESKRDFLVKVFTDSN